MIIVRLKGGLGNQLFQYLAGQAVGEKYNQSVKYELSYFQHGSAHPGINKQKYQLDSLFSTPVSKVQFEELPLIAKALSNNYVNKLFRVLNLRDFREGAWHYLLQNRSRDKVVIPLNFENLLMDGYWQNLSLIQNYRKWIMGKISAKHISKAARMLFEEEKENSIALHVRRTDLLSANSEVQSNGYYIKAIALMKQYVKNPRFFVFSDDIFWCKEHLFQDIDADIVYSRNETALDDFHCMMHCRHNIIACSTFSWWAAWLNSNEKKIVISPDFGGQKDILPEKWIIL